MVFPITAANLIKGAADRGMQFAYYFPMEQPPGWYVGNIITTTTSKVSIYVDYGDGTHYQTKVDKLQIKNYGPDHPGEWLLLVNKGSKSTSK